MTKLSPPADFKTVDLHDHSKAFPHKDRRALLFTYYIFRLLAQPRASKMITAFASWTLRLNLPVGGILKRSIFPIFCAGETISEALITVRRLEKFKVNSVLDYVAEGEVTPRAFEDNKTTIVRNVNMLGQTTSGNAVSAKISALEDTDWFRKINAVHENELRGTDLERYKKLFIKLDAICEACAMNNVLVYFDAEETSTQDVFDRLVERLMKRYNSKKAVVYNTLQMYLTSRIPYLETLIQDADQTNYIAGIKLVRGAYEEKERLLAKENNIPDPIHRSKSDTDNAFNLAVDICLKNNHNVSTCIASHNEKSTQLGLDLIREYNISNHYENVRFSQLYGMSDHITFNLAASGYSVSKYIPYGEVKKAIPYLIRRAAENSSAGGQMPSELRHIKAGLKAKTTSKV